MRMKPSWEGRQSPREQNNHWFVWFRGNLKICPLTGLFTVTWGQQEPVNGLNQLFYVEQTTPCLAFTNRSSLGAISSLEKLRVAVGLFNPRWTAFPTTCNLMSLYQLALCYYRNWTQTVFPAHVMLLSMTLCRFGIFPLPSFYAQPQLSTNPSPHPTPCSISQSFTYLPIHYSFSH